MTSRALLALLLVLALAGAVAACGGGDGDGGESGGGAEIADGDNGSGAAMADGGGEPDSAADKKKDEEVIEEEPTADNQVLLGAQFFGEQPADFGVVAVGTTRTMSFTLKNLAQARAVLGTSLAGPEVGDFSLDPGTCGDGVELDAGASCTLKITFAPTVAGERRASLVVGIDPGVGAGRSLRGGASSTPTTETTTSGTTTSGTTTPETRSGERTQTETQTLPAQPAPPPAVVEPGGVEG